MDGLEGECGLRWYDLQYIPGKKRKKMTWKWTPKSPSHLGTELLLLPVDAWYIIYVRVSIVFFGPHSVWNIYSMTVSLAYCCICGYLFLIHCFCLFFMLAYICCYENWHKVFKHKRSDRERDSKKQGKFQGNVKWRNRSKVTMEGNHKQPLWDKQEGGSEQVSAITEKNGHEAT